MQSKIEKLLKEFDSLFQEYLEESLCCNGKDCCCNGDAIGKSVKNFISTSIQQLLAQRDEEIINMIESVDIGTDFETMFNKAYREGIAEGKQRVINKIKQLNN